MNINRVPIVPLVALVAALLPATVAAQPAPAADMDPPAAARGSIYTGRGLNPDPQWSDLPADLPESHLVTNGDTLWDICGRIIGNPWFWRKVAEINPHIKNPDWIYPGETVLLKPGATIPAPDAQPQTTNVSGNQDFSFDLDSVDDAGAVTREGDTYKALEVQMAAEAKKGRFVRQEGFIADVDDELAGEIVNSPLNKTVLYDYDIVYLRMQEGVDVKPGSRFQVIRLIRRITHPDSGEKLGFKVAVQGVLEVIKPDAFNGETPAVMARLVQVWGDVERGDKLRTVQTVTEYVPTRRNLADLEAKIVDRAGEAIGVRQGMLVYLDRGLDDGLEKGNTGHVFRREDGTSFMESRFELPPGHYENDELPRFKLGELTIVQSYPKTSVALVTGAKQEFEVGSQVVFLRDEAATAR